METNKDKVASHLTGLIPLGPVPPGKPPATSLTQETRLYRLGLESNDRQLSCMSNQMAPHQAMHRTRLMQKLLALISFGQRSLLN